MADMVPITEAKIGDVLWFEIGIEKGEAHSVSVLTGINYYKDEPVRWVAGNHELWRHQQVKIVGHALTTKV